MGQIWLRQSFASKQEVPLGTSSLTGSELGILLVQQEVLFGHFRSDRKYFGILTFKPEVFVVSTGSASSHFQSTAHGSIKARAVPQGDLYLVTSSQ